MSDKQKEEKLKALQLTLDKMEKSYGKGTVMRLGDKPVENIDAIPTGSLGLDIALEIGGILEVESLKFMDLNLLVNHISYTRYCRSSTSRWYCSIYRCRRCF